MSRLRDWEKVPGIQPGEAINDFLKRRDQDVLALKAQRKQNRMSVHKADKVAYFRHAKKNQFFHRVAKKYAAKVSKLDSAISKLSAKLRNLEVARDVARDSHGLALRKAEEHRSIMAGYSDGG